MNSLQADRPSISINVQTSVITLHKKTLALIGDPEYIQILINPSDKSIVVCVSNESDHLAHRVDIQCCKKSYRLYSKPLIQSLIRLHPTWPYSRTFRIYGKYFSRLNIAKFSI